MALFFGQRIVGRAKPAMFGWRPNVGGTGPGATADCCGQSTDPQAPGYITPCCRPAFLDQKPAYNILGRTFRGATMFSTGPKRPA